MTRRLLVPVVIVAALAFGAPPPASAQSIAVHLGGFTPRAEDARVAGDVLFENLNYLLFDINDFKGFYLAGDFLLEVSRNLEVGVGVGYYQRSVPSVDRDFVNEDGSEIEQQLKLRIVPVNITARFLPMGNRGAFQPYVGAGIGLLAYRYSETGQFVDYDTYDIYRESYVANGMAAGPVILGGVRVPVGRRTAIGGEIRYQRGSADIGTDFWGEKLDLGGLSYSFTLTFRY